jgi:hypothetical protein
MDHKITIAKLVRMDLTLLVGTSALALFDYFDVDELHGLTRQGCIERIEEGGTYFDGFQNLYPDPKESGKYLYDKHYIFINSSAFTKNMSENFGLIFHESTHYQFSKYWNNLQEKEEEIITDAENLALDIIKIIF